MENSKERQGKNSLIGVQQEAKEVGSEPSFFQLTSSENLQKAFRLRYSYVVDEKHWLPEQDEKVDKDEFDSRASHFGVFERNTLAAYARVIKGDAQEDFMFFSHLQGVMQGGRDELKNQLQAQRGGSAEVSRLVIDPQYRRDARVLPALYKGMIQWGWPQGIFHWYMVIDKKLFSRLESHGFIIRSVSTGNMPGDPELYHLAVIDLKESRENFRTHNPNIFHYYFSHLS